MPKSDSMAQYAENIRFRLVAEGSGGTIDFHGGNSESDEEQPTTKRADSMNPEDATLEHVGVKGCGDSVGVYFVIDDNRCFCAQIKAKNPTSDKVVDTSAIEDEKVREQVLKKLQSIARHDRWNQRHRKFGTNCIVVCSNRDLNSADEDDDRPINWYIIQALRDFFESMADLLNDEAAWLRDHQNDDHTLEKDRRRPQEWSSEELLDNTEHRISHHELELAWKSERLGEIAEELEVDTRYDGFIVDHHLGTVYRLGEQISGSGRFLAAKESSLCEEEWLFNCSSSTAEGSAHMAHDVCISVIQ